MPSPTDPIFGRVIEERTQPGATRIRQDLIRRIQEKTGRRLVTYIASANHPMSGIIGQDVPLFEDLVRGSSEAKKGDLLIHSYGGDPNVAERLLSMCRDTFSSEFNIIVPESAKSAATLIALGADKIFMGYSAELGPIDPQIPIVLPNGQQQLIPAVAYLGSLEFIREKITKEGYPANLFLPILAQIRPEVLRMCDDAIKYSEESAAKWLKLGMLKNDHAQAEKVAKELATGTRYRTHAQVINYREAKEELKLNAELIPRDTDLWTMIWELYVRSVQFFHETGPAAAKLFESATSSVNMMIEIRTSAQRTSSSQRTA